MKRCTWLSSPSRLVALAAAVALTLLCGSWRVIAIELVWGAWALAFAVVMLPESIR